MSERGEEPAGGSRPLDVISAADRSANDLIELGRTQADLLVSVGRQEAEAARKWRVEPAREFDRKVHSLAADLREELAPRRAAVEANLDRLGELSTKAEEQVRVIAPAAPARARPGESGGEGSAPAPTAVPQRSAEVRAASAGARFPTAAFATVAYWTAVALVSLALVVALILFLEARDVSSLAQ